MYVSLRAVSGCKLGQLFRQVVANVVLLLGPKNAFCLSLCSPMGHQGNNAVCKGNVQERQTLCDHAATLALPGCAHLKNTLTSLTAGPTASTMPINSCPKMSPARAGRHTLTTFQGSLSAPNSTHSPCCACSAINTLCSSGLLPVRILWVNTCARFACCLHAKPVTLT